MGCIVVNCAIYVCIGVIPCQITQNNRTFKPDRLSDFNETWYTCCLGTHSTKSKILGQSDQWCGRYGPSNFESFGKNGHGCQPLNPHISGTSDPIFIKLILMDRQFDKDSKYVFSCSDWRMFGSINISTFVMTMKLTLWIT